LLGARFGKGSAVEGGGRKKEIIIDRTVTEEGVNTKGKGHANLGRSKSFFLAIMCTIRGIKHKGMGKKARSGGDK